MVTVLNDMVCIVPESLSADVSWIEPGPSSCEVTVKTTKPPCRIGEQAGIIVLTNFKLEEGGMENVASSIGAKGSLS